MKKPPAAILYPEALWPVQKDRPYINCLLAFDGHRHWVFEADGDR